jgi:hypothetical protein
LRGATVHLIGAPALLDAYSLALRQLDAWEKIKRMSGQRENVPLKINLTMARVVLWGNSIMLAGIC